MTEDESDLEFLQHLHTEKLSSIDARNKLILQKLAFATGLLSLGS